MKITHKNLEIKVVFSNRKSIGLYVKPEGIELRAPINTPLKFLQSFINNKSRWLESAYAEQRRKALEKTQLINGSTIYILGKPKILRIIQSKRKHVSESKSELVIGLSTITQQAINRAFTDYLTSLAKHHIPIMAKQIWKDLGIDKEIKDIRFKRTKSKWGHCTSDGVLQFNWLIMMAPEEIIKHVVIHEVCHLEHMNHSSSFWSLVSRADPKYKQYREWLSTHGHRFPDLSKH